MLKKNIKPVLLAGALALATAVSPVLAVDNGNTDTQEITPVSINVPISKTLNYQNGVKNLTSKTFTYQVTAGKVYDRVTGSELTGKSLNVTNNVSYLFQTDDLPVTYSDGNVTKSNQNIVFAENDTTVPGIYSYTIQEQTDDDDANITYDNNKYTLFVQVTNKDSDPSNGFVFSYVVYKGEVTYESIEGLPSTPKPTNKTESISFVNKYTENDGILTISKVIAGNAADATQDFTFEVNFTAPSNTKDSTYTYTVNGGTETERDIKTENGKIEITLKGGQQAVFSGLPTGTTYTITEKDATDYTTEYVQLEGGIKKDNSQDDDKKSVDSGLVYDDGTNSVVFTNTKSSSPITGVIVNNMPYIALLGASGAGLVVLAASKKRSK